MKTSARLVLLLAAASSTFAVLILPFTNWDDLTKESPDIVIARCTATPEPRSIIDGQIWSDIEVLTTLKGETKPGTARMVSGYWPRQGERFLMFATCQSNQAYRAYNATEAYRVVPLGLHFHPYVLAGKSLDEQIRLLLRLRLDQLTRELQQGTNEIKRLAEGLKK